MKGWFDGPIKVERSAEMRYGEQIFEIDVPLDGIDLQIVVADCRRSRIAFIAVTRSSTPIARATRRWCSSTPASPRSARWPRPRRRERPLCRPRLAQPRSHRKAYFGQWIEVPVYALDDLVPGQGLEGPAIVEAETTTVVINSGDRLTVNALGWLDIRVAKAT